MWFSPLGGQQIANSILCSTAVVAAIVGFAAQDAIKDMFAGLQISIYKLFDVFLKTGRQCIDNGGYGTLPLKYKE